MSPSRRRVAVAAAAFVVVAGLAVALLLRPEAASGTGILTVRSRPAGATVTIDGVDVGQTPYFGDNRYPTGSVKVRVELKGYRAFVGQFDGGEDVALNVTLARPGPNVEVESVHIGAPPDAGPEPEFKDPDLEDEAKAALKAPAR